MGAKAPTRQASNKGGGGNSPFTLMDKPEPPYEYRRRRPPQYDYEEHTSAPVVSGSTVSTVSNSLLTAYKINPIMIAMILLLLAILGAFGWYQIRNDDRIYAYIAARDQQQANLWDRLVAMAKDCRTTSLDKEAYPSLDFPKLTTPAQPTPNKRDGK